MNSLTGSKSAISAAALYRVILPVPDIDRAAEFFGAVLQVAGQRVSASRHYFDCDGTILACYDPEADGDDAGRGWRYHENQYLYFSLPDLEAAWHRVNTAGGETLTGIESMPWGERLFYALDPFGSRLSFVDATTVFTG